MVILHRVILTYMGKGTVVFEMDKPLKHKITITMEIENSTDAGEITLTNKEVNDTLNAKLLAENIWNTLGANLRYKRLSDD